jgi:ATP-dependent DNA ligase
MIKVERFRTADCVVGASVSEQSDRVGPLMLGLYNPQRHCPRFDAVAVADLWPQS